MDEPLTADEHAQLDKIYNLVAQLEAAIKETRQYQERIAPDIARSLQIAAEEDPDFDEPLGGFGKDIVLTRFTTHTQVVYQGYLLDDDREI